MILFIKLLSLGLLIFCLYSYRKEIDVLNSRVSALENEANRNTSLVGLLRREIDYLQTKDYLRNR